MLFVVGNDTLLKKFYLLRGDSSLYHHTFWQADAGWHTDALQEMQNSVAGDLIALRTPPLSLSTGDTLHVSTADVYSLIHRIPATSKCVLKATRHLSERDVEMVHFVLSRK